MEITINLDNVKEVIDLPQIDAKKLYRDGGNIFSGVVREVIVCYNAHVDETTVFMSDKERQLLDWWRFNPPVVSVKGDHRVFFEKSIVAKCAPILKNKYDQMILQYGVVIDYGCNQWQFI